MPLYWGDNLISPYADRLRRIAPKLVAGRREVEPDPAEVNTRGQVAGLLDAEVGAAEVEQLQVRGAAEAGPGVRQPAAHRSVAALGVPEREPDCMRSALVRPLGIAMGRAQTSLCIFHY